MTATSEAKGQCPHPKKMEAQYSRAEKSINNQAISDAYPDVVLETGIFRLGPDSAI
jgi:hypothetical protein